MRMSEFRKEFHNNFVFVHTLPSDQFSCAYSSMANLLGGLSFGYGTLNCNQNFLNCKKRLPLLSFTPSRQAYPHGYLLDEGFHNMVACRLNPRLCFQSLSDWVETIGSNGWIPSEQPRGAEQQSFAPELCSDIHEMNPPTLMFNFLYLNKIAQADSVVQKGIEKLWPKLQEWFN